MLRTHRIGAIFYLVADIDRTEAFYRDVVGLSVHRSKGEHGEPDWLTAPTAAGVDLLFFQGEPRPGNSPIPVFDLSEGGIDAIGRARESRRHAGDAGVTRARRLVVGGRRP
jgi:glyoxylase I family protein